MEIPIEDSIDLHTFRPADIKSVVEEYVRAAHEAGLRQVRLIHGRGIGVQRGIVQAALEKHPLVDTFADAGKPLGCDRGLPGGLTALYLLPFPFYV